MATPRTYDVGLGLDGDLPELPRHITGYELVVQRVQRTLGTFSGEYLLDRSKGLPYFDWYQQKPPRVNSIGALIRARIEAVPGVAKVTGWKGTFDAASKTLSYTGTVKTVDGDLRLVVAPLGTPGAGNANPGLRPVITMSRIAPSP